MKNLLTTKEIVEKESTVSCTYSDEFLACIDRAEEDIKAGRVHRIKSLSELQEAK